MNNFFNNILKKMSSTKNEKQDKEEEDMLNNVTLNFEVMHSKKNDDLDHLVNGIKINGTEIHK